MERGIDTTGAGTAGGPHTAADATLANPRSLISEFADALPDPVVGCGADGRVVYWSPAAVRAYGYAPEEAAGRRAAALLHTRFPRPLMEILEDVADLGSWQGQVVHTTKHGDAVAVESRWAPRRDAAGALAGWFAIDRPRPASDPVAPESPAPPAEEGHRRDERLESLGRLAAGMAHDFNNALAIIINYTAFVSAELGRLRAEPSPAQRAGMRRDLAEISTAAERAADLTNRLLAVSRQEAGGATGATPPPGAVPGPDEPRG